MSIRTKLILSFIIISLLGASLGVIAIWSNQQLIEQLAFKEKPTRFAIQSARQISAHANWAERHLYLFLSLRSETARDKFFEQIAVIEEKIDFLESNSMQFESASLIMDIKSKTELLLNRGTKLVEIVDQLGRKSNQLRSEKFQDHIFDIHDVTHHLSLQALKLENLLTDILNRQIEHSAANSISVSSEEAEVHLILYLMMDDNFSRKLFFSGVKSINEQIEILNNYVQSSQGKRILDEMIAHKEEFLKSGKILLQKNKLQKQRNKPFLAEKLQAEIAAFNQAAKSLRNTSVILQNFKIQREREPRETMLQKARVFNYTVFTIVSGVFGLSILLGFWMAIGLSRSSKRLQIAAREVGNGNLDAIVDIQSKDEMGLLAQTFNQMVGDLKQTHQVLDERNKVLNLEIEKRKLIEKELQQQATTDPLTGVLNRRAFFDKAGRELLRSIRYQRKIAVLMLDIDHFKNINDTYGHSGGDQILRLFASEVANPLRASDLLGRIGGEEFAVILPETDSGKALNIAERIRLRVQKINANIGQKNVRFTVSIGVSEVALGEKGINIALNRADKALYRAKDLGRNRVCINTNPGIITRLHSV
jgi:diguanylate cyclase (GGDEF)-like protein